MTRQAKLTQYISQELLSDSGVTVSPDDNLLLTGLVDSVGIMSLILFIEEAFGVKVPPEDVTIEHFLSVATIDTYLERRLADVNHA